MTLGDERQIGSMAEWHPRDVDIECPHCGRAQVLAAQYVTPSDSQPGITDRLRLMSCRSDTCRKLIVTLMRLRVIATEPAPMMYVAEALIWPRHRGPPQSLDALPLDDLRKDAREAFATADDSPRASAALARRFVQSFIRSVLKIEKRDLDKEIDAVLEARVLPPRLAEDLDAVRQVGNFGVHPIKALDTGAVLDVEPGETEWLLSVVVGLSEWHAQEQERAAAREALNEKLRAAGKPELKSAPQDEAPESPEAGTA